MDHDETHGTPLVGCFYNNGEQMHVGDIVRLLLEFKIKRCPIAKIRTSLNKHVYVIYFDPTIVASPVQEISHCDMICSANSPEWYRQLNIVVPALYGVVRPDSYVKSLYCVPQKTFTGPMNIKAIGHRSRETLFRLKRFISYRKVLITEHKAASKSLVFCALRNGELNKHDKRALKRVRTYSSKGCLCLIVITGEHMDINNNLSTSMFKHPVVTQYIKDPHNVFIMNWTINPTLKQLRVLCGLSALVSSGDDWHRHITLLNCPLMQIS